MTLEPTHHGKKLPGGAAKKKGLLSFLSEEDARISRKSLLGVGTLGAVAWVAFGSDSDFLDFVIPHAEGHTSGIGFDGNKGFHSSHSSHASHASSGFIVGG